MLGFMRVGGAGSKFLFSKILFFHLIKKSKSTKLRILHNSHVQSFLLLSHIVVM
jgi:hypothetical protein